jgi:hypothetical protein
MLLLRGLFSIFTAALAVEIDRMMPNRITINNNKARWAVPLIITPGVFLWVINVGCL